MDNRKTGQVKTNKQTGKRKRKKRIGYCFQKGPNFELDARKKIKTLKVKSS